MDSAVTALFAFFLVLGATHTAVGDVLRFGDDQGKALPLQWQQMLTRADSQVEFLSATAADSGSVTNVDVTVANQGRLVYSRFEDWDVTVRYTTASTELKLYVPFSGTDTDNTWKVQKIWLDPGTSTPEAIDPGILNPHEEAVFRIRLNPQVQAGTTGVVTISSPEGSGGTIFFDR